MNDFDRLVNFENSDGAGSPPPEQGDPPQAGGQDNKWTPEQQAEFDRRAAALRKSAAADERKKTIAEFEAKQKSAQDEAEQKRLAEEGQYRELAKNADTAKTAAEKRAEDAEKKAEALALQMAFDRTTRFMNVEFVSEKAAEDAFTHLDLTLVGDDKSGMKKAIEQLVKDYSYYFGDSQTRTNTDAKEKGQRQTNKKGDEERQKEIISRFNIRKPR